MHWLYSAAIAAGLVLILLAGLMSVLRDLLAIDDWHLDEEMGRRRRAGDTGPGTPSHDVVDSAEGPI